MPRQRNRRGQALIMVCLALIAICGVLGLAVDLGWSYFVKKSAQAAADSGAMAAVKAVQNAVGTAPTCTTAPCQATPSSCPATGLLNTACQFAAANGFTQGGNVNVTVAAGLSAPPTAPGVAVSYWVTVRVNQQVPQLFSAVLGNTSGLVSARATAAIVQVVDIGSLILLDRQNDPIGDTKLQNADGSTMNMYAAGGANVTVPGGIILASAPNSGDFAAQLKGGSTVTAPFTDMRGPASSVDTSNNSTWLQAPTPNQADTPMFQDPESGKGQPPLDTTLTNDIPVEGGTPQAVTRGGNTTLVGVVSGLGTQSSPYMLAPGRYYSTTNGVADGNPINLPNGYYQFQTPGTGFGEYIFFGGLNIGGSGAATVTFGPGRYVMAGVLSGGHAFSVGNQATLNDTASGNTSYPGEIFIDTNMHYPGLPTPAAVQGLSLVYGDVNVQAGNNQGSSVTLNGLNATNLDNLSASANVSGLSTFAPFFLWQDQGNTKVRYNGSVVMTSGLGCVNEATGLPPSIDNPCLNQSSQVTATSPGMSLLATSHTNLNGAVYQPRGGWLVLGGGSCYTGPLRVVTGALDLSGGPCVTLQGNATPITSITTALVE